MARLTFEEDIVYIRTVSIEKIHHRTHNTKRFVFQIDLEWSNGNYSSSFRSYNELFEFQCELLDAFPKEAGKDKDSERVIPFLPGKKLFRFSTYNLANERLPKINEFTQKLIALPENISRCDIVLSFFRSNWPEDRLRCRKNGTLQKDGQIAVKYSVRKDTLTFDSTNPDPPNDATADDQTHTQEGSTDQPESQESGNAPHCNNNDGQAPPQENTTQSTHEDDKPVSPKETSPSEDTGGLNDSEHTEL